MTLKLAVILVAYNSYPDVTNLLSTQPPLPKEVSIIVVDNTEPCRRLGTDQLGWLTHQSVAGVLQPGNVGYLGAAKLAHDQVACAAEADMVMVANVDLATDLRAAYERLAGWWRSQEADPRVGCIGGQEVALDGRAITQRHYAVRPPSQHYRRLSRIFRSYPLAVTHRVLWDARKLAKQVLDRQREAPIRDPRIFAPHGALMVFTRAYFAKTKGFDFPAFLFCEEIFVGLELQRAHLDCIYLPGLVYSHLGHGSVGSLPARATVGHLAYAHAWAAAAIGAAEELESQRAGNR